MSEQRDHGKNITRTSATEPLAKLLILRLHDVLTMDRHGTMRYFTNSLHIPTPIAVIAILVEFLGGLALLAGAFTRYAALLTAVDMFVAAIIVHLPNGFFLNWANDPNKGHGVEHNVALVGAALALILLGEGRLSVDESFKK